jgi:DNA-binding transcriptional regulator YhcF (GntR family)
MPIRIDKTAEVPVHEQIRQQVIFGITTGEFPPGYVMPSRTQLANQYKISPNTVGAAYTELAETRWLVSQKGRRFVVIHPGPPLPDPKTEDIDTLIVRLSMAAQAQDVRVSELVERVQKLVTAEPPDHLLIVEPEPGIGLVLKYEVQKATGQRPVSCSIPELWDRPKLLERAAVLVPAYLADLLDFLPIQQRATMTRVVYSPFGKFIEQVRNLTKPSVIGMISVSGPGMKTMDGVFAESIGDRHRLIPFLLEWPVAKDGKVVIRKLDSRDLPPDIDIRVLGLKGSAARNAMLAVPPPRDWASHLLMATDNDLKAVDVLFTDSITKNFVPPHPRCITYELLSKESLRAIAAIQLSNGTQRIGPKPAER